LIERHLFLLCQFVEQEGPLLFIQAMFPDRGGINVAEIVDFLKQPESLRAPVRARAARLFRLQFAGADGGSGPVHPSLEEHQAV